LPLRQSVTVRALNLATYDELRTQWQQAPSRGALEEALRTGALNSPERFFAAVDALNPDSTTHFRATLDLLAAKGVQIALRNYRTPYGWWTSETSARDGKGEPRAPTMSAKRGWPWPRASFPFLGRERRLILYYPDVPPRTPTEFAALTIQYSRALFAYRMKTETRSPILSLPFGQSGFPTQAMQVLYDSESQLYAALTSIRQRFPEVELPLPPTDRIWSWRYPQMGVELIGSLFYPSYIAFDKSRPNRQHFDLFSQEGTALRDTLDRKFHHRLQMQWAIDRWRNFVVGTLVLGLASTAKTIVRVLDQGLFTTILQKWDDWKRRLKPENVNQALQHYQEDQQGWDIVNDFYDEKIKELEKEMREKGDPKGKLRQEIERLIKERDELKN
jgi:hypothetical protein